MKTLPPKPCGEWCDNCKTIHLPDGGFPSPRIFCRFDGSDWIIYEPGDEQNIPEKEKSDPEYKDPKPEE